MSRSTDMREPTQAEFFEDVRPRLLGVAYRILGSRSDAEDAVQDTFLKWSKADPAEIDNPAAWLTTACARRSIDLLRAADRARVDYVGAWLPEPVHTPVESDATARLELDASVTTAFLLLLERLTPKERAAYLLREVFDTPYPEIATALDLEASACRKLVSRAKTHIDGAEVRHTTPLAQQQRLLDAFKSAVESQAPTELASLLSDEIRLTADGGGKAAAILETVRGKQAVLEFVSERLSQFWRGQTWMRATLNGARGYLLKRDGAITAAVSFAYDETGAATGVFIMRNPDKLAQLDAGVVH